MENGPQFESTKEQVNEPEGNLRPVSELIPGIKSADFKDVALLDQSDYEDIERKNRHNIIKTSKLSYPSDASYISSGKLREIRATLKEMKESPLYSQEEIEERVRVEEDLRHFKGETVIDLGAGSSHDGYVVADEGKAASYVAVEPVHFEHLQYDIEKEEERDTEYGIAAEDMLKFLQKLPDNQFSFIVSGINDILEDDYWDKVEEQIYRTLSEHGVILNKGARAYFSDFDMNKVDTKELIMLEKFSK
jgi:hypothetical protein